jgi:hypothetical protein
MRIHFWAALLIGAALGFTSAASAQSTPALPRPACYLQVIPDYTFVVAYKAVLRLSPRCTYDASLRVRKSSTINTVRNGAPYQPYQGPWDFGDAKSTVPNAKLWTSLQWVWEYFDPTRMNPRTGVQGIWRPAEVLRAAPGGIK